MPPTGNVCCPMETHRNPAAVVGSPVDLGTAVEEGSPAAAEGLAGMLPAAGHTAHYLRKGRGGQGRGGNDKQCDQYVGNCSTKGKMQTGRHRMKDHIFAV